MTGVSLMSWSWRMAGILSFMLTAGTILAPIAPQSWCCSCGVRLLISMVTVEVGNQERKKLQGLVVTAREASRKKELEIQVKRRSRPGSARHIPVGGGSLLLHGREGTDQPVVGNRLRMPRLIDQGIEYQTIFLGSRSLLQKNICISNDGGQDFLDHSVVNTGVRKGTQFTD